jgi:hypothetical protein
MRMRAGRLWLAACVWLSMTAAALAQEDAGLVNQVSGEVSYADAGASRPVQAFMKVRDGDRISVGANATVRIIYFRGRREETWSGPATFTVSGDHGEPSRGKPQVHVLPSAVPLKLARLPELVQAARLGGVTVRGIPIRPALDARQQAELTQAQGNYNVLRTQVARDDITPELYMIATLQELGLYEDMAPLAEEIARHRPLPPEVEDLLKWIGRHQPPP